MRKSRLVLVLLLIGRESGARFFNQSQSVMQNQSNYGITFDTQLKTALLPTTAIEEKAYWDAMTPNANVATIDKRKLIMEANCLLPERTKIKVKIKKTLQTSHIDSIYTLTELF